MEKLSDVVKTAQERIANPFLFSLLVSWLIWNWEISVAILWMTDDQLKAEGFKSILDFVKKKPVNSETPIYIALAYTICFPFIKIIVNGIQTSALSLSQKLNNWILRKSNIPVEKYLNLSENFNKRTKYLEELIKSDSKTVEQFNEEQTKHLETKKLLAEEASKILQYSNEIANLKEIHKNEIVDIQDKLSSNDLNLIQGIWEVKLRNGPIMINESIIKIEGDKIYLIEGNRQSEVYYIKYFSFNRKTNKIFFIKYVNQELPVVIEYETEDRVFINDLSFGGPNIMRGMQNDIYLITYVKKS